MSPCNPYSSESGRVTNYGDSRDGFLLTRAEAAVWFILYRDTKPDGTARTGQTDLARRAGCNVRSVGRALARLIEGMAA